MSSRREFLQHSAAASAALLALSTQPETARGYLANDTLQVGCIGTGGRCRGLMKSLVKVPNVKITAVCDVWDVHLDEGKKLADAAAFTTKDHRELLARKDVDAVLIGAPDHQHVPLTIDACAAGKDVYVEKPLTHDPAEGASVIAAQNDHKRIVQVGMQQRSMPHIAKARELIQAGGIGKVLKIHLSWNRNTSRATANKLGIDPKSVDWKRFLGSAPQQDFNEYRFRNWRWFWDFGGGIFTDLMVHWIDVAHWVLDLKQPLSAASIGDFHHAAGIWETPDTVQTLLRYADPQASKDESPSAIQAYFEGTFSNARNAAMIEFMGTEGSVYIDRGRTELIPERNSKVKPSEWILNPDRPRGADFYPNPDGELLHLTNWVDSVRARTAPVAPVEAGVLAAAAAQLSNQALRSGQVAVSK
ncbi:Gfo/Idh/MocA family protein [Anatilimnocola floriformis]|uniref:Gfo/Idh/MocA family protein n=1 Tax=Anatilimnocola floriformis TaxID=2948575 RepID=UPI0020C358AA|nr:Gfo/Idh/MocA family oxidoreductase [Anatilimnocola floriformis]